MISEFFSGMGTIFMLHRVFPFEKEKLPPNENMKISPEYLESLIIDLKERNYQFISLDELYDIFKGNSEKVSKKIVFTLDDGYKDNFTIAYPIFKKYNVPFTIYLTTSFPEMSAKLWWYVLEDLLINEDKQLTLAGESFSCQTDHLRTESFLRIRQKILKLDYVNFDEHLDQLFINYNVNWSDKCKEVALTWEQIKEMSKDPLVTMANHTHNHPALNQLSEVQTINEIDRAQKLIEENTSKKVEHFAYPFGSRNEIALRECEFLKKYGFKTATTTRNGNIFLKHKKFLESLPRVTLTENFKVNNLTKIRRKRMVIL